MKGFKDSTRTHYSMGGSADGPKGAAKVSSVMHEWGAGRLHSGSKKGPVVKNQKQAVAIALNQASKMAKGGAVDPDGDAMADKAAALDAQASMARKTNKQSSPAVDNPMTAAINTRQKLAEHRAKTARSARPKQQPLIQPSAPMPPAVSGQAPMFKKGGLTTRW